MALTEAAIRNVKPSDKQQKLFDGEGLFLLVAPNGGKWWRLKYRFGGKEKLLSLGCYPEVGLKDARERRFEARKQLSNGVDPSQARQDVKAAQHEAVAGQFGQVAEDWLARMALGWTAGHKVTVRARLDNYILPWIKDRPIRELKAPEILSVLRRLEARGTIETSHRALLIIRQVVRFAMASGLADADPTVGIQGALIPSKATHLAAITEPVAFGGLLRAIDGYMGLLVTRAALQLAPLVFVRPGELRHACWSEVNLEKAEWSIPAEKMKMRMPHLVPLSTQAVAILKDLKPLTGGGQFVFPSPRTGERPMSENALTAALRSMGYSGGQMTAHGFRAAARTMLDEVLRFPPHLIEHQLAHAVRDPNGRAYNRTTFLDERRAMMQKWADYLDKLRRDRCLTETPR